METPAAPTEAQVRQWAMFVHLSLLAGFIVPGAGFVAPIVLWQIKKNEMPAIDPHGKMVVNWLISSVIYIVVAFILCLVFVGLLLLPVLGIACVAFPVIGGIKANNGELWKYPLTIQFLK